MKSLRFFALLTIQTLFIGNMSAQEIRSVLFNTPGSDEHLYFEISGSSNLVLSNVWFIAIDGDGAVLGVIDETIDLSSYSLGSNGLLLYRSDASTLPAPSSATTVVTDLSFDPENGDNTFLLVEDFTGFSGQDLDTNNDGVLEITPWSNILDGIGVDEDNACPDIAPGLGFEVVNDNGGSSCTFGAGYIFSDGSDCNYTNDWRGAVVEFDPNPDNTFRINGGSWYHDGPCGFDCLLDDQRPLTPGNSLSPLPLEIGKFTAYQKINETVLIWETFLEHGMDLIKVEHSNDAVNFKTIAEIPTMGGNNSNKYQYNHQYPNSGNNYYRLNYRNTSGIQSYSNIRLVRFENSKSIAVHPNPTIGTLIIETVDYTAGINFHIYSEFGKTLINGRILNSRQYIDVSELDSGCYFLTIELSEGETHTEKIIKF